MNTFTLFTTEAWKKNDVEVVAIEITMSPVKTQAAIFRDGFGVNQHDKVLRKQQSLGLSQKKLFSTEDIKEEYITLHYRTDFTFKKYGLLVEIDEKGHADRKSNYEKRRQKNWKSLVTTLLELIVIK